MEKSISVAKPRGASDMGNVDSLGSMEIRYAAQALSGHDGGYCGVPSRSAMAQVAESGYSLPLALAMKAATKAIATCASNGYPVSAVVVDSSGVISSRPKATTRRSSPPRQPSARHTRS